VLSGLGPRSTFFTQHLFSHAAKILFRKHYADPALMEDILRDSGLDWTAVRPPRLTDIPATGTYRVAYGHNLRGGWSESRADVAQLMLRVLEQPKTIKRAIGIAT
jgi:putative NADH-flavin reductase